jgi:hypothetical protein
MKTTFLILSCLLLFSGCKKDKDYVHLELIEGKLDPNLKLNEVQVIGSHNSYHKAPHPELMAFLEDYSAILPENPEELDYHHESLLTQLNSYGIRQFEIDAYHDPEGGLYANKNGKFLIDLPIETGVPELEDPGFKVLHIVDIDYNTHEYTLTSALSAFRDWSFTNQGHFPLLVLLELKNDDFIEFAPIIEALFPGVILTDAPDLDEDAITLFENEIDLVFEDHPDLLFRPDDLRVGDLSISESITEFGWPTLDELQGKIILMMINGGSTQEHYVSGGNLEDRNCFVSSAPGNPLASIVMVDHPVVGADIITTALDQGYLVRTRADAGTLEARVGSTLRRDAALASGAQFISTDYYRPDPRHLSDPGNWTDYSARFDEDLNIRPNPYSN